jgi:hypothetical protein
VTCVDDSEWEDADAFADDAEEAEDRSADASEPDRGPTDLRGPQPTGLLGDPTPPALLRLSWEDTPRNAASETELAATATTLSVRNDAGAPVIVELSATADAGTSASVTGPLGAFELATDETRTLAIDIAKLGITLEDMEYSGMVLVTAQIFDAGSGERLQQLKTPALYFHPRGAANLAVYDGTILGERFNAGNFRAIEEPGSVPEAFVLDAEEKGVIERIVKWAGEPSGLTPAGEDLDDPALPDDEIDDAFRLVPEIDHTPGIEPEVDDVNGTIPPSAVNDEQTLCVRFQIQTTDSGTHNSRGHPADWWQYADSATAWTTARGVRVTIDGQLYWTNPSTGCVTFRSDYAVHDVTVWTRAKNAYGSYVRIHNGSQSATGSYPGRTMGLTYRDVPFTLYDTTYLYAGSHTARWTAMAALALSQYRFSGGLSGISYHVAESPNSGPVDERCDNRLYANDPGNNRAYIRLGDESCGNPGQDRKFVVAHEYGHGLAYQFANVGGQHMNSVSHAGTSSCGQGGDSYAIDSIEWSSIGAREGFAHFVSAKVWNNRSADGLFEWFNDSWDLERHATGNPKYGYLRNVCCWGSDCDSTLRGAATIIDWLNAYWDFYTNSSCSPSPSTTDMLRFYRNIITQTWMDNSEFFRASETAVDELISDGDVGSCYAGKWDHYACWAGISFQGTTTPSPDAC